MVIYEQIFKQHGFSETQQQIIDLVGKNKTVLEIGASAGYMTRSFLGNNCTIDVVEIDKNALSKLPKEVRKKINHSIEDQAIKKILSHDYDFIIMADVLEHLINPKQALKVLNEVASKNCCLIVSLPNIASWVMRKQLFFKGDFEYQESGILDKTHLHFYTVNTLPKFLEEFGWKVESIIGSIIRLPFEGFVNKVPIISWIFKKLFYQKIAQKYPNLTYYHFFVTAFKK